MKSITLLVMALGFVVLMATTFIAQTSPQSELPKVPDARNISIAFSGTGIGRIMAADERGKVRQYLEEWENSSKEPNVITYVLVGDEGPTFTATWGKGPINTEAFTCVPDKIPEFDKKIFWVATVNNGELTFQEIQDDDVKGLFGNILSARRDYNREASASNQRTRTNYTEQNILGLLKEKNRKKWFEKGWLQPASSCVRHFS